MATIVLDAGHGGYDFGAVNGTRYEKDDNLRMALAVANILRGCNQNVILTRGTDVFVSLSQRVSISNSANADIFVSLHRNSSIYPSGNGLEIFTAENPPARTVTYARNVLNELAVSSGMRNNGLSQENFYVVRYTYAPAMLVELGFVSNAEDNRLFDANFGVNAEAIARGILKSLDINCTSAPPPTVLPPGSDATVRAIQQSLNSIYGAGLAVDGLAGAATKKALVRALQIQLNSQFGTNLVTDGVFGPATKTAIRSLRQGDRGNLVWILQAALYVNGFSTIPDGVFGPNTAQAVRNFQSSKGLAADGIAGANTFEALMSTGATQTIGTVTTSGSNLNMRSAPSTTAPIIGSIPNGSRVTILGTSGNFYQVVFNGVTGFASRDFIRI